MVGQCEEDISDCKFLRHVNQILAKIGYNHAKLALT